MRASTVSIGTMRMPPLVERRITQYSQAREQPRSASSRNMSESSVFGVRIAAYAGKRSSEAFAIAGIVSPCRAGTKALGIAAAIASSAAVLPALAKIASSAAWIVSSHSPMRTTSAKGASEAGSRR